MLTPLALLAVVGWMLQGQALHVLGTMFVSYSALFTSILPQDLLSLRNPMSWFRGLAAALFVGWMGWAGGCLSGLIALLAILSILRLWYLRQYYSKQGERQEVELLRRGLLISLWSHISVWVTLVNPY